MNKTINTLFVGKVLHQFDALPSTNQYAQDLLTKTKPAEGTIILTPKQFAGKGQLNNKWESEPGKNLTFSLIIYPSFLNVRKQFLLNQMVSLSVYETLKAFLNTGLSIKWPNDIYVLNKKIAGILIQNSIKGSTMQSSVIGIGLNINQQVFLSKAPNPTSLAIETGQEAQLEEILHFFCKKLEINYLKLKAGEYSSIQTQYQKNLFRCGISHSFKKPDGSIFTGRILGVNEFGKLVIESTQGKETFNFKEISYIL